MVVCIGARPLAWSVLVWFGLVRFYTIFQNDRPVRDGHVNRENQAVYSDHL